MPHRAAFIFDACIRHAVLLEARRLCAFYAAHAHARVRTVEQVTSQKAENEQNIVSG